MNYYFAPMEGITGYVYRNVHRRHFPGMDKYFSPFLTPGARPAMSPRECRDVLPERNQGCPLVPQILTNRAENFVSACGSLKEYGYREVNLNLGCPSGTVVSKGKGSGFLAYPRELDGFLEEVFSRAELPISIKTRIGKEDAQEFGPLLEIFNKYPIKELIIHPRVQTDYYKNSPNMEVFAQALASARMPVCYNGDLFTREACQEFARQFPQVKTVMLGRGMLRNPALAQELQGGPALTRESLSSFLDDLCGEYGEVLSGERPVLFKMKELWFYMGNLFEDGKKCLKRIKKAQRLSEYKEAAAELMSAAALKDDSPVSSIRSQFS